jgi:hypothetical protein
MYEFDMKPVVGFGGEVCHGGLVVGDSIKGRLAGGDSKSIPLNDVREIFILKTSPWRTTLFVAVVGGVLTAEVVWMSIYKESPLLK